MWWKMTACAQSAHLWRKSRRGFAFGSTGHARKISLKTATKSKGSFSFIVLPLPSLPRLLLCSVKIGAVTAPRRCVPWAGVWAESLGTTLWLNHIQFCWVPCHPHESSFSLLLRHSRVRLWARCQLNGLNPRPWTWLHIYTGMCADSLSYRVNTPHDFYVFAHIWQTGGIQQKVVNLTSVHFGLWSLWRKGFGGRSVELCDLITAAPFFMSSLFCTVCFKRFLHQRYSYKGLLLLTSLISRLWVNATRVGWRKGVGYHLDE